ncbi:MAG: MBL fold metallo-hydrolase [Deltaproteobacteria bacterium]|nr:MBL fold metallo-hydrolase [Candidatus Zymogenaceae bacterium]
MHEIQTLTLALPFRLGTVNCYLVKTETGFILIDTGGSKQRGTLEQALANAGCQPGDLKLIILTHGDFDHTGNVAYLRQKFGAPIAMHRDDAGMLERGDMFSNRKRGNFLLRIISSTLFGFGKSQRCQPDLYVEEGDDFLAYGFDAQVIQIPGHSLGSIGILTADGDLFCGDLLENTEQDQPALGAIMDDPAAASASVEKLSGLAIRTVYPGHGQPFPMQGFK